MNDWHPNHYRFPRVSNHNDWRWMDNDLHEMKPPSNRGDKITLVVSVVLLAMLLTGVL